MQIEKGNDHPQAKPEIVFETPISAVIDGHNGMGQLISVYAMKKAIEKSQKTGVGIVTVRESNHFGIAGYYAKMACDEGLLGMACTNSEAIMDSYVWQKSHAWIKPNRSSYAGRSISVFFDCSTTVVTRGKCTTQKCTTKWRNRFRMDGRWTKMVWYTCKYRCTGCPFQYCCKEGRVEWIVSCLLVK